MDPLRISLAPSGDLRLHLPSGRSLDFPPNEGGLRLIQQTLRNADSGQRHERGHIGSFPTQHVIEAWKKQDVAAKREAVRESYAERGIDIEALEFKL